MLPEIQVYVDTLRELRAKVLTTLEGLDGAALDWAPLARDTNSLLVLATHMIGSEHGWVFETLYQGPKTRNRSAEFLARARDINALQAQYERTARETEGILDVLTEQDLAGEHSSQNHGTVTARWIIVHVIKHYSEHLGQMYLTRQLQEKQK